MRLALFQYNIEDEPEQNVEKIRKQVCNAKDHGIDLLILPEVCLTGFGAKKNTEGFAEESELIQSFCKMSEMMPILGGFRIRDQELSYNRALFFDGCKISARYDKQILFKHWREHDRFAAGKSPITFDHRGWKIAPFICYELRFPEVFRNLLGSELLVVIANWPRSRREHWLTLLRARAIENQAYVAGVNRLGSVGTEQFCGDSVIFGPRGELTLDMGNQEGCAWADLDLPGLRNYRKEFPVLNDCQGFAP